MYDKDIELYKTLFIEKLNKEHTYFYSFVTKLFLVWFFKLTNKLKWEWLKITLGTIYLLVLLSLPIVLVFSITSNPFIRVIVLIVIFISLATSLRLSFKKASDKLKSFYDLYQLETTLYMNIYRMFDYNKSNTSMYNEAIDKIKQSSVNNKLNYELLINNLYIVHNNQVSNLLSDFMIHLKSA